MRHRHPQSLPAQTRTYKGVGRVGCEERDPRVSGLPAPSRRPGPGPCGARPSAPTRDFPRTARKVSPPEAAALRRGPLGKQ